MKMDCSRYASTLEKLKHHLENKSDIPRAVSMLASISMCPMMACILKGFELFGKTEELVAQYKSIQSFYGYSEIVGLDGKIFNIKDL